MADFRKQLESLGGAKQYELRIHDYQLPYVSVFERVEKKHIGMYRWPWDDEPLSGGDNRMQLLSCQFDEVFQDECMEKQNN
jgi:hypothetical protein